VDALLNSAEYMEQFGDNTVPYQRRRILPQRAIGETPFNLKTPRYGPYYRQKLGFPQLGAGLPAKRIPDRGRKGGDPADYRELARLIIYSVKTPPATVTIPQDFLAAVPRR